MFHGVKIQDGALIAAAVLSNRYISDRFLPDKAIDLVDEACAMIRTEMDSAPAELDDLRRKIMQHEIEEAALKKETDQLSKERLEALQKELAAMRDEFQTMSAKWENEKAAKMCIRDRWTPAATPGSSAAMTAAPRPRPAWPKTGSSPKSATATSSACP